MADNLDAELERLNDWLGGLMSALDPSSRRKAARIIARMVRGKQAKRIAAQKNPDGSSFAPRKERGKVKVRQAKKFLYPSGGSGGPRVVYMKSWRIDGKNILGWDRVANERRTFDPDKIIRWLPLDPGEENKRAGQPRRMTVKEAQMFRELRRFNRLTAKHSAEEISVGYAGVAARIASVHQFGKFDNVDADGPRVKYPQRQLLGQTGEEESEILDIMREMIEGT